MPNFFIELSSSSKSTPSSTNALTSVLKGDRQRFTKKPATSFTKMGVFPESQVSNGSSHPLQ